MCSISGSTEKELSEYFNLATALQENILLFLEDLSVKESLVLDRLVGQDCISADECDYIRTFNNTHDAIRYLITTIKRRDTRTIFNFLDIVGEDSPHLKTKVEEKFNDKQNHANQDREQLCPTCLMTKIVDLKDIADILWKENLLSDNLYAIVIEDAEKLRDILWNTILHCINKRRNAEQNIQVLIKALEGKYSHIAKLLKGLQSSEQNLTQLQCGCYRSGRKRRRFAYASSSAASSYGSSVVTSGVANMPRLFLLDSTNTSPLDESAEEMEPKLQKLKESFDFSDTSKYDDPNDKQSQIPIVVPESSENSNNNNETRAVEKEETESNRKRHRSEPFKIQKDKFGPDSSDDPRLFNRTVSTVVCGADSTSTTDETHSATGKTPPRALKLVDKYAAVRPNLDLRHVLSAMGTTTCRSEAEISGANDADGEYFDDDRIEDFSSSRNAKQRELRRQFMQRQESAPAGWPITASKTVSNLEVNIGTRAPVSKKSKRSLKRKERRERNSDPEKRTPRPRKSPLVAEESANGNIPYNPMWPNMPQSRNTLKWDYPEAKRHRLMASKMAEFARRNDCESKSDTEAKVREADSTTLSEYTI